MPIKGNVQPSSIRHRRLFLIAYGLSGASALIYEVTWTRLLTMEMGHGVVAASTVLAAFMGGLAFGSAVGGRFSSHLTPERALRAYAIIEVLIGAFALLLPIELAATRPWLAAAYADGAPGATFQLVRLTLSLVLLAIPAAAMGATFPIASRWIVRGAARAPAEAARLYAANTIGAATGAALAGFVLLPSLGLRQTTFVGVALNLGGALVAWIIAARTELSVPEAGRVETAPVRARPAHRPKRPVADRRVRTAALALGLSGAASLALQIVWMRLAASILGPTTYAFTVVVTVFVGGLAAGNMLGARLVERSRQPIMGLAMCLLSSAALSAVAVAGVDVALLAMARWVGGGAETFYSLLVKQVLLVAALLLPMSIAFGASFPFAIAVSASTDDNVSSDLGVIYAVNTTGAILGALVTGFVLVGALGLHDTIRVVTVSVAVGALALLLVSRERFRGAGLVASVLVGILGVALPAWDKPLLSSGLYKYAGQMGGTDLDTWLAAGRLLYYREGATATVSVRESLGTRSLSIDGKVDASNGVDMLTQRLLAHLPLLLHPDPERIAIVGLGGGVTLGAALTHPVAQADVLEISPEVVEASTLFEAENHRALADPRTRLITGDGRLHLMLSPSRYDVIVSEPSNPWIAGNAALFTHEFFEAARDRLTPGGILCQWAHTYDISDDDLRSIVATFLSVFPDGALWQIGKGDLLLLGSTDAIEDRLDGVARHWNRPGVAENLRSVGVNEPFDLLSLFIASGPTLSNYAQGAAIQTDDRSRLEFSGPRSVFGASENRNDETLRGLAAAQPPPAAVQAAREAAGPAAWRNRGEMMLKAELHEIAWHDFARAIEADPADAAAYDGLIRASNPGAVPGANEAMALLRRLAGADNVQAKIALARMLARTGNAHEATALLLELYQRDPGDVRVLEQLASVLADAGDQTDRLPTFVGTLRKLAPGQPGTRYHSAALLFQQGRPDLAIAEIEPVVRDNAAHALAQNVLGVALGSIGETDRARDAFEASLRANPLSPTTYLNLGMLEMEAGRHEDAVWRYAESLLLDPSSGGARRGLAEARAATAR